MWRIVIFLTINIYSFCQTKDVQKIGNIIEINQLAEDAIEDAILMGVDPDQVVSVLLKTLNQKHR